MTNTDKFIDIVEHAGADTVAGVLGFHANPDAPEDLAEDMLYAFDCLPTAAQEQALRVLAMGGVR